MPHLASRVQHAFPCVLPADRLAGGMLLSSLQLNGRAHYVSNTRQILFTYDISEASSAFVPTPYTFGPLYVERRSRVSGDI